MSLVRLFNREEVLKDTIAGLLLVAENCKQRELHLEVYLVYDQLPTQRIACFATSGKSQLILRKVKEMIF